MRPLLLLALAAPAFAQWGKDLDPGLARQMIQTVEEDLAKLLQAPAADRPQLVLAFVQKHGTERIEAIKRFRGAELKDVFLALLQVDDWHVKHRALLLLSELGDPAAIDAIVPLLSHPHRRIREMAALTLLRIWDGRKLDTAPLLAKEEDFHVKQCLAALARRVEGTLPVTRLSEEKIEGGPGGLHLSPYVEEGGTFEPRTGKGGPPTATRWVMPLLGWGEEEVPEAPLESYGGKHPGVDEGACLDGAGVYATTDGIVLSVATGEIILEHVTPKRETLRAVYLHTGAFAFVEPGERVTPGQLLGTIGMGFSAENGGTFAHLEYRIGPPGPPTSFLDPARFLAVWVDRTTPLLPPLRPLHPSLRTAAREAEHEAYAKAAALATRARDAAVPGSEAHADAVYLLGLLASVPAKGVERARRLRDAGYPADALKDLEALHSDQEIAAWKKDPLFEKALKGEPRLESAERRGDSDLFRKLLTEFGDTCLRPRIEERLP